MVTSAAIRINHTLSCVFFFALRLWLPCGERQCLGVQPGLVAAPQSTVGFPANRKKPLLDAIRAPVQQLSRRVAAGLIGRILSTAVIAGIVVGCIMPNEATSDDWPQILGPNRNGVVPDLRPVRGWKNSTPQIYWKVPVGRGMSGATVVGNQVILFHRIGESERVESIDVETGKSNWKRDFKAFYTGGFPDNGPRCTPLIVDDIIVVYGAAGNCHALKLHGGNPLWSRDLASDYDAPDGYFGAGSSPIHSDGMVIINVGGRKGESGFVALDIENGRTRWTTSNEAASYSSPIRVTQEGKDLVFAIARLNALLIDPQDGQVISSIPFGARGPTVNAATPLLLPPNRLFLTANYGVGAKLCEISDGRIQVVWSSDNAISSQYNTPVYSEPYLFGIHGREDVGVAELRCIDSKNGNVMWKKEGFGVAHLLLTRQTMIAATLSGELVLIETSPNKYIEIDRCRFTDKTVRALPAVSRGRIYLRDTDHLFSIQIAE